VPCADRSTPASSTPQTPACRFRPHQSPCRCSAWITTRPSCQCGALPRRRAVGYRALRCAGATPLPELQGGGPSRVAASARPSPPRQPAPATVRTRRSGGGALLRRGPRPPALPPLQAFADLPPLFTLTCLRFYYTHLFFQICFLSRPQRGSARRVAMALIEAYEDQCAPAHAPPAPPAPPAPRRVCTCRLRRNGRAPDARRPRWAQVPGAHQGRGRED